MFDRIKNLKLVKQLKENVSPKLRWLTFSNKNKLDKSTTDYLENIMKSYELLVDAVMHNIKKNQLQATDNLDIE